MAVHPATIPAGAFETQFSEGKQIEDSNMYTGYLIAAQSSIKVMYHLESQSKNLQWWYEFAMSQCSPYLLRVFWKCKSSFVGKELLFTEVVEETLHDWVKKNSLIDSENPERLTKSFIGILGDIINGIIYFRCTLRQPHGNICANNVYLVNGNAKLGKALNHEWYKKEDEDDIDIDINKFCGMVKSLFEGSKLPFGLDHLCGHLQKYNKSEKYLMNAINHPIMLTPDTRCEYRLVAYDLVKHHPSLKAMVNQKLRLEFSRKKNSQWSWMDKIHGKVFEAILHFKPNITLPPSPPLQPVQVSPPQQVSPLKLGQPSLRSSQHQMSLPQPMHPPKLVQVSLPQSPKEPLLQFGHLSLQQRQLPPQQFGRLSVPSPQPPQRQVSAPQPMQVSSLQPPQEPLHEQHLPLLQFGSLPPPQPLLQFGSLPPPQRQQQQQLSVHPQQQPPQPQQQPPQSQLPQTQSQLPSPSICYNNTPVSFLKYNRHAVTHVKDYDLDITNDTIDRTLSSFVPEFMPLLHEVLIGLDVFVKPLPVTI